MTLKEFENVKEDIDHLEKSIEYLGKYLKNLDSVDGSSIPVGFTTIESDEYDFFFSVDSIKELTENTLKRSKEEYIKNIKKLNDFGLAIEADPEIISMGEKEWD